ncbi:LacI family DNA-binding transcriptional regulator [Microbacterium xylanilyticum]
MVTLKDLAAAAGVSPSAVSLVLNDRHLGRVNEQTALRIREAADRMGYVPNVLARSLRTKRTQTIGVLSDGVASVPFAGRMLEGVQTAAWDAGYLAMIIDTTHRSELVAQSAKSLLQRDIEAMILAVEYPRLVELPPVPPTIPLIVMDGLPDDPDKADSVVPDEVGGAYAAVAHLIEAGHSRIAFCNVGGDVFIASKLRQDGYANALRDHGLEFDPDLVLTLDDPSTAHAFDLLRVLLSRDDHPSAVFCFSDQIALAAYQACTELGLRIPDDLSVVGFDDQRFIADALRPGLTTVRLPHFDMGRWAAQRAIDRIHGDAGTGTTAVALPCPLITRASVGPPKL